MCSCLTVRLALCRCACVLCPEGRGKASQASTRLLFWGYTGLLSAWSEVVLLAWQLVLNILNLWLCRYAALCVLIVHLALSSLRFFWLAAAEKKFEGGQRLMEVSCWQQQRNSEGWGWISPYKPVQIFFLLIVLCVTLSDTPEVPDLCISELVLMLLLNHVWKCFPF